ncbi:hypothetical protein D3C81_2227280 [compost metagenome]
MTIDLELNRNYLEALLRHCQSFTPATGDSREDRRLSDALAALQEALDAADRAA